MVARFGMDPKLGQVSYEVENGSFLGMPGAADWRPRHYGEETAAAIDTAVRGLIDAAYQKAVAILTTNRSLLDQAAADLLTKETLSAGDLLRVAGRLATDSATAKGPAIAALGFITSKETTNELA